MSARCSEPRRRSRPAGAGRRAGGQAGAALLAPVGAAVLLLLLLRPTAAAAQTLDVPASVQAAADGSFSYQATFTAGPGGDNVFAYVVENVDNTDVGIFFGDLFCVSPLAEGEQLVLELPSSPGMIEGSLVDAGVAGSVRVEVDTDCSCCPTPGSGLLLTATTAILPFPQPVPALSRWMLGALCAVLVVAASAALRHA